MDNDFQPVVGHRFNFRSTPMPNWNGVIDCEVLVVEPNKKLSYSWSSLGLESVVVWTLLATKGGTLVRMEQSGFRPDQEANLQGRELRLAEVHRWPGTSCRRAAITAAATNRGKLCAVKPGTEKAGAASPRDATTERT